MKKRTIATLMLVGVSICGLGAAAAPRMLGHDGARPLRMFLQGQIGRMMTLRSELDVTSEQRDAIKKIVDGHRSEIVAVAKPIVEKRRARAKRRWPRSRTKKPFVRLRMIWANPSVMQPCWHRKLRAKSLKC